MGSSCCLGLPILSRLPSKKSIVIYIRQDKLITFKLIFDTVWDILITQVGVLQALLIHGSIDKHKEAKTKRPLTIKSFRDCLIVPTQEWKLWWEWQILPGTSVTCAPRECVRCHQERRLSGPQPASGVYDGTCSEPDQTWYKWHKSNKVKQHDNGI